MNRSIRASTAKSSTSDTPLVENDPSVPTLDDIILPEPIPPLPSETSGGRYTTRRTRSSVSPVSDATASMINESSGRKVSIAGFVSKLYRMVNESTSNLIQWGADGTTFLVTNPEEFSRHVLPHFFKHNNFSSFVRQLNMYGFHKVPHLQQGTMASAFTATPESTVWEFSHASFIRGRTDLLVSVRRNLSKEEEQKISTSAAQSAFNASKTSSMTSGDSAAVIESLRAELNSIRSQQSALRSDLASIQRDNQLLWHESLANRERHAHQQQVIDRILRFLASVFSADGKFIGLNNGSNANLANMVLESTVKQSRKRPLLIEGMAAPPPPNLGDPEELRRQVLELIAESGSAESPAPLDVSFNRLEDLNTTTRDISNDISLIDDELDALQAAKPVSDASSGDFDFSNYLNVQSLE